ncbi:unnamed protein product [Calypogeia fissa]
MPRFRVATRLVRVCSSLSAKSCPSCASAASASKATSTGLSSCSPSSSCSCSSCSSKSACVNPSPPSLSWRSNSLSSSPSRQKEQEEERFDRSRRISSPIRDVHNDLITSVNQKQKQQQQVWLLGQRPSPPSSHRWGLRSFSVAYYSNDTTNSSSRDLHDHQVQQQLETSDLVSPSVQKLEGDAEEVIVVDELGFSSRLESNPAAPAGDNRPSSTFLRGAGEEKVTTQLDFALSTSTDEDEESEDEVLDFALSTSSDEDESDPPELELLDFEEVDSQSEELDDDVSRLEHMAQEAAAEREEVASSELLSDFLDVASTTAEEAREMGLIASESDQHQEGVPYLHTLSVDEIKEILEKTRAKDVRILQVRKCCEWVDQLVFASGRSSRHLRGMADAIVYKVKQSSANVGPNSFPIVEGRDGEQWMAIDCGNIVVHLFLEEARSYYNLEEFWTKKSNPRLVET